MWLRGESWLVWSAIVSSIWTIKAIDKLRRSFLWNNDELASGGRCLVRWANICRPLEFGGLGITDLKRKSAALRVRWLWQRWTSTDRPWSDLPTAMDESTRSLFNAAVDFRLGDGLKLSFWRDPWLDGRSLDILAPDLYKACTMRNLSVYQALFEGKWLRHFKQNLTAAALNQFLLVYAKLENVQLRPGTLDTVVWRWSADGTYSATTAYKLQFEGSIRTNFEDNIWNSGAPLKCRVFAWLAILGKCHTADCLEKKGWPHNAACVLCLSEPETALHLLATCSVTIRLWERLLSNARLPVHLAPNATTPSLDGWISQSRRLLPPPRRKSWTTLVQLTWWTLWKERNTRIFQNKASSLTRIQSCIAEEAKAWKDAGKPAADELMRRPREPD